MMKFGDKGSEPGNFNYPWDVAVNSQVRRCGYEQIANKMKFIGYDIYFKCVD